MSVGYTYKIINEKTGKYYYGSTDDPNKRWWRHKYELKNDCHHCIHLQRAYNKYGHESFKFEIDKTFDKLEYARTYEQQFLDSRFEILYNTSRTSSGGDLISYHPNRDLIVQKMKKSLEERFSKLSPEERKKIYGKPGNKNSMYGKTHSDEVKKKLSDLHKGNTYTKGKKLSDNHKKILSDVAKKRTGDKNAFYGKTHSDETKKIIGDLHRGVVPTNARRVEFDGTIYSSVTDAGRQLGVSPATIINWIKKEKGKYLDTEESATIIDHNDQ